MTHASRNEPAGSDDPTDHMMVIDSVNGTVRPLSLSSPIR